MDTADDPATGGAGTEAATRAGDSGAAAAFPRGSALATTAAGRVVPVLPATPRAEPISNAPIGPPQNALAKRCMSGRRYGSRMRISTATNIMQMPVIAIVAPERLSARLVTFFQNGAECRQFVELCFGF